jgi:hypothetical protein
MTFVKGLLTPTLRTESRPDPSDTEESRYVRSFLVLRVFIGVLGVTLPFVLLFVDGVLLDGDPFLRDSVSGYYYSGAREIFVGVLSAIAIFLISYKVVERNLDNTLSLLAGLSALGVAFFPTGRPSSAAVLTPLQVRLSEGVVKAVHFTCAGVFIVSLAALCICFGIREGARCAEPHHRSPTFWRWYHWSCAGIIGLALLFIVIAAAAGGPPRALLIGEAVSVLAFGASWLMKGLELDMLRKPRRAVRQD